MTDDRTRAPKVDARATDDIVAQTEALLTSLTAGEWRPAGPARSHDPLGALVRVFADMAGQLLDGINAVPDASFAAFLRLIGVEAQRPAPARAPLTFRLAAGAPVDAVVPAGTRVGASAAEDDTTPEPIVFETEAELVVTRARLLGCYAHAPERDRLDAATEPGSGATVLAALSPVTPGVHDLQIACPALLARPGAESWIVTLDFEAAAPALELRWLGDTGPGLTPLAATSKWDTTKLIVTIDRPPALLPGVVAGRDDVWLTARLVPKENAPAALPKLRRVTLGAKFSGADIVPKKVLRGATQLEVITDFYPFEATPALESAFAVDAGDALAQPAGTSVTLNVTLPAALDTDAARPKGSADLRVVWELLTATGWLELGRSSTTDPAILTDPKNPHGFVDDTYALSRGGRLRFRVPTLIDEQRTGGKAGRWIRARIVQGNYGAGATLRPPQISTLRLAYSHELAQVVANQTVARDLGFTRVLGVMDGASPAPVFTTRPPGAPELGDRPALYLAFDRAFEPRPVQLYVGVLPPDPSQTAPPDELPPLTDAPRLEWEYLGVRGWTRLGVRDETRALRQRGVVTFVGPTDLARAALFDAEGLWLRARWISGRFRVAPKVDRVCLNTTWASHAATRRDEVLGSGTGAPGQTFNLVASPVLAGERIEVRERDAVSERDLVALREELGDDAVTVERDAAGALTALWVRWTPVTHFHGSGPADRHYVLDAARGVVTFGDSLAGRAPPQGRANIRAAVYATGGGPRGNRPVDAVTELKTAIAYVDSVTNIEAASGGTGREDDARVRARGPRRLRHRGRAVTAEDLEDLAFEAAPEVARAHALPVPFNPIDVGIDISAPGAGVRDKRGWITDTSIPDDTRAVSQRVAELRVVIVPHGDIDQPAPSIGLLERVEAFLKDRAPPAMRAYVSGPRWIKVAVRAAIVAAPGAPADRLVGELRAAITRFLHPLTGGELGQGWDFGRIPRRSHIYRLIAHWRGVHHIESLVVLTDPPLPAASEPLTIAQQRALAGALVYSGAHELTLVAAAEDL